MSADFLILVLAAIGAAYAAVAAIHLRRSWVVTLFAVLLAAFVGVHTVILAIMTGDGRILPGLQLNPNLKAIWGDTLAGTPFPKPDFTFLILLVHLLIVMQRPGRRGFWLPLPATLIFVGIFVGIGGRTSLGPTLHEREIGPRRTAYLTLAPIDDKQRTRIIVADVEPDASFANVRFVHESGSPPPKPYRLFWTRDGKGLVLMVMRRKILGLDIETGRVAGGLPEESHEWPRRNAAAESVKSQMQLARWAREVDAFIREHGGLYVR